MFPPNTAVLTHYKCIYSTSLVSQSRALRNAGCGTFRSNKMSTNIAAKLQSHSTRKLFHKHRTALLSRDSAPSQMKGIFVWSQSLWRSPRTLGFTANSSVLGSIKNRGITTESKRYRTRSIATDSCLRENKSVRTSSFSTNSSIQGAQRTEYIATQSRLSRKTCLLNGVMSSFQRNHLHTSPSLAKLIQFNLADIGEGIREVTIKEWNPDVKVGAMIGEFDTVCEVESDKASVSITSRYSGVVKKVFHGEGDVALVGKPLIEIEVDDDGLETSVENNKDEKEATNTSSKDSKEDGNTKEFGDKPIESDENDSSCVSSKQTEVKQINSAQSELAVNKETHKLRHIEPNREWGSPSSAANRQTVNLNKNKWKVLATPSVRRMIKQYDIDTKELRGTGKQGRVLKEDIVHYMNSPATETSDYHSIQNVEKTPLDLGDKSVKSDTTVIPIRGYVKGMFKSMTESNTIPTLRLTEEVDTTRLKEVKNDVAQLFQAKHGLKLTFMPFFIKALSVCVSEYPILNASIDANSENIVVNPEHNVCIAIDTQHGLVVPHIKRVSQLNLVAITRELLRLQASAQEGKVSPSDLLGGTISMSNVGNVGGTLVQPIIVPRQVCIVAFGKMQHLPRFDDAGCVVARSILNVTWAADHRVVDGATVARAATLYRELVENPMLLLTQ
uniref:Dihydrolipoamide acetyltransferase component of pyruvate dehydrogenase complex n=1 Tax=Cacopsylla melanoneura TaxID=428564 RepID=A0A8D9ES24_9HEMI